jgi:hypothetical protein
MKRKKHKLKTHGVLLKYHEKLSFITHGVLLKYHEKLSFITHGVLAKNIKVPVMGY